MISDSNSHWKANLASMFKKIKFYTMDFGLKLMPCQMNQSLSNVVKDEIAERTQLEDIAKRKPTFSFASGIPSYSLNFSLHDVRSFRWWLFKSPTESRGSANPILQIRFWKRSQNSRAYNSLEKAFLPVPGIGFGDDRFWRKEEENIVSLERAWTPFTGLWF